ncbi:VPLPA-CTERM sorting domain-containing protein [Roseovarius sp. S1116L3]|uniref:VPLPA-CTERM sorting domain-containing protein n=1 Tax=Roseovarius roseus TaxID=3342636 RepID=UPI00372ACAF1
MSISTKILGAAAAIAMTALAAPAAYAATVFNLGGSSTEASSFAYSVDGIGLTVTGERNFFGWDDVDVTRRTGGLGVTGFLDTSSALDGQIDERLTFSFDQNVKMMSIMFTAYDDNDPYDIYVDSGAGLTLITGDSNANPYLFSPFLTGDTLRIAVDGNASAFRVSSMTVAAVPLPAAGWLMIAGLGGLGALRRRRKNAAAA